MTEARLSNDRPVPFSIDDYATAADFQGFFASEMSSMFRLALLLTADPELAERCLILAMRECLSTACIFKQWVEVWARRAVARRAISLISAFQQNSRTTVSEECLTSASEPVRFVPEDFRDSAAIFTMGAFQRIVYVLSILEGYPIADCALLLGRPPHDVRQAQNRAICEILAAEEQWRSVPVMGPAKNSHSLEPSNQHELAPAALLRAE